MSVDIHDGAANYDDEYFILKLELVKPSTSY
jgi:hypothetical protein